MYGEEGLTVLDKDPSVLSWDQGLMLTTEPGAKGKTHTDVCASDCRHEREKKSHVHPPSSVIVATC